MLKKFLLYWRTIRYLKFIQIWGRFWFKFKKVNKSQLIHLRGEPELKKIISPALFLITSLKKNNFTFMGVTKKIDGQEAWNRNDVEKLWLYNLHYFNDLVSVESEVRVEEHHQFLKRWIKENPVGEGNGWEPYPLSLRILNIIKWILRFSIKDRDILESLYIQCKYLEQKLEIHLLGNHLFENVKTLCIAGLFFGQNGEGQKFLDKAERILKYEILEQFLDDGSHFEQSPMYHAIMTEGLLDLVNFYEAYGRPFPSAWRSYVQNAIYFLVSFSHPDGGPVFFNDSALNIAKDLGEILKYATRLGLETKFNKVSEFFPKAGTFVFKKKNLYLVTDLGPIGPDYLPGHAHADNLSFEMSYLGKRIFVNSGTSSYQNLELRRIQRSTASHNTLEINNMNSSELWGAFRVARRAKTFITKLEFSKEKFEICAFHDGYKRLKGKPRHERRFEYNDNVLTVTDLVHGNGEYLVNINYHLEPSIEITLQDGGLKLNINSKDFVEVKGEKLQLEESNFYPEFGVTLPSHKIKFQDTVNLPFTKTIKIYFSSEIK